MEQGESSRRISDEDFSFSIPRGGPIFVQDFVSPLTRASIFETDVFHELESLKAELRSEPTDVEEDISVDELKIYSDEELVAEAMKIAFEDDQEAKSTSGLEEDPCCSGAEDYQRVLDADLSASWDSYNDLSSDTSYKGEKDDASLKKRKRNAKKKGKSKNGKMRKSLVREKDKDDDSSSIRKRLTCNIILFEGQDLQNVASMFVRTPILRKWSILQESGRSKKKIKHQRNFILSSMKKITQVLYLLETLKL